MTKKLEEIFWKGLEFVDAEGKKVNPKPIGVSKVASSIVLIKPKNYPKEGISCESANKKELFKNIKQKLKELSKEKEEYLQVNAYSRGEYGSAILRNDGLIIQFYKI